MAVIWKLLITIAVTTVIAITLMITARTTITAAGDNANLLQNKTTTASSPPGAPKIKASRFLMQNTSGRRKQRNPNAADHCHKNPEVCSSYGDGGNSTSMACCNNKCVDLECEDNCGACGNKCKFSQTCCRGECVYLAFDKRHCGRCHKRCSLDGVCVLGLCNYA